MSDPFSTTPQTAPQMTPQPAPKAKPPRRDPPPVAAAPMAAPAVAAPPPAAPPPAAETPPATRPLPADFAYEPQPDRASPHPLAALPTLPETDYSRFEVRKDERIVDMRGWRPLDPNKPNDECAIVYFTRRELKKIAPADELRIETRTSGRDVINRAGRPNPEKARAFSTDEPGFVGKEPMKVRQLLFDVSDIPVGQEFTLRYTSSYWNSLQTPDEQWFGVIGYEGSVKTSMLVLFPEGRPFKTHRFQYAPTRADDPKKREDPRAYTGPLITFAADDKSWVYWEIPTPKANYVYRIDWTW